MKIYQSAGGDIYHVEEIVRYTIISRDGSVTREFVQKEVSADDFKLTKDLYKLEQLTKEKEGISK